MRFSLLSNGTLITDEMAPTWPRPSGATASRSPSDGSIATTHDACRGEGNFVRALGRGSLHSDGHRVPVAIRVTIHRQNLHDLENIARFCWRRNASPPFSCNSACHLGLCRKNADLVELTPAERSFAMRELLRLNRKYSGRITATPVPLPRPRCSGRWSRHGGGEKLQIPGRETSPAAEGHVQAGRQGRRDDGSLLPGAHDRARQDQPGFAEGGLAAPPRS